MMLRNFHFQKEYFLFLLPLFFVFHGFVQNVAFVPVTDALFLIVYYLLVTIFISALFLLVYKNWRKAALFTFLLFAFHFFFGSFHDYVKQHFNDIFFTKYVVLLPAIAAAIIFFFVYLKRSKKSFNQATRFLNFLLIVLIAVDILTFTFQSIQSKPSKAFVAKSNFIKSDAGKPDVYLIIADEYSGQKALKDLFEFDNSAFENELAKRGFHTVKKSRSNYNFTPFSVASLLNYNYLPIKDTNHTINDVPMVMDMIRQNEVARFFQKNGYHIINNSYFDLEGEPAKTASSFLPYKSTYITAQTLISRIKKDLYFNLATRFKIKWVIEDYFYHHKKSNELLYNQTIQTAQNNIHPKFIYTHLMLPHYPYYFDENGRESTFDVVVDNYSKERYTGYIKYANKRYLKLIDHILSHAPKPPVILFISDHGFRDYSTETKKQLSFVNICNIYTPDKNYSAYHDSLSNVNVFRVLLNTKFNQQLPLLKDSSVFLKD